MFFSVYNGNPVVARTVTSTNRETTNNCPSIFDETAVLISNGRAEREKKRDSQRDAVNRLHVRIDIFDIIHT